MPQPGLWSLVLLLLLLGLAGAAPLSKQEVTRCLEEALKDELAQGGPREGPCMQLFQEDGQLPSLLRTLEELRRQEISKHHLGPEREAEREEQEEVEEKDFRKKKRGPEEAEGERRLGQEVREEEEEVKTKEKSEIKEQEVRGEARVREEEEEEDKSKKRRGSAEAWVSRESLDDLRKRRPEGVRGSEEQEAEAWGRGRSWGEDVEKRVAEKASDEETAQFEEEEKGVRVSDGGHSLWQGAGPAHGHHHQPHPEQESEEEEEDEEAEKKEQHELERLEQMGEELKRAAEALGRRG
ncbi:coiled-coil domain-containing glutamate-rich protein 2 [Macrotis lagotis]|uniref:coiled-coil domain-containing glutamate-rich protein 2 n=1 Tax=Macrotis lagotis TaxID=92651 RepID=UPI003D68E8B8